MATVAQLSEFDEILDVRSPAEFEEDRIPGAANCPALDNAQRAEIGTLYVQVSPFVARKRGAALVAHNIADHLLEKFQDKPKDWRPLIYCWRGGQRSGAFVTIFRQIGWDACQLQGGYKSWRQHVVAEMANLTTRFEYRVVCGPTGSGKTRFLQALKAEGAQVLDLEDLASHRGSLLGAIPDAPQPSQKFFETRLYESLQALDPGRPVFVEAESRRIGRLTLPESLYSRIGESPCLVLDTPLEVRIPYLLQDYHWFPAHPETILEKFEPLRELQSKETIARWHSYVENGDWTALVRELMALHYDLLYRRSQNRHYNQIGTAHHLALGDLEPESLAVQARRLLA